jgi:hypothetical protein
MPAGRDYSRINKGRTLHSVRAALYVEIDDKIRFDLARAAPSDMAGEAFDVPVVRRMRHAAPPRMRR